MKGHALENEVASEPTRTAVEPLVRNAWDDAADASRIVKTVKAGFRMFRAFQGKDPLALQDVFKEGDRRWMLEMAERANAEFERLDDVGKRVIDIETQLAQSAEVHRLLASMRWEAAREATDERRTLLACVAAALTVRDIPLNDKARVERAMRILDAEDIAELQRIDSCTDGLQAYREFERSDRNNSLAPLVRTFTHGVGTWSYKGPTLQVSYLGKLIIECASEYFKDPGFCSNDGGQHAS